MKAPPLSIVMPNYNHAQYVGEAIEAVLSQSYTNFELIVVDDCSTDNSLEVIEPYGEQDTRMRLLVNETNRGVVDTLNRGLNEAVGEYIYFPGADDRILPGFLETCMTQLTLHPQASMCLSNPATLDNASGMISGNALNWSSKPCFFTPQTLAQTINGGWLASHSSVARRDAVLKAGGHRPEMRWHHDWFLQLIVGFRHGICYVPETLALLRVLPGSHASGMKDKSAQDTVLRHILETMLSTEYGDVLPYLVRGNVLSHFGEQIIPILLKEPRYRLFLTPRLLRQVFIPTPMQAVAGLKRTFFPLTPEPMLRVYRRMRDGSPK